MIPVIIYIDRKQLDKLNYKIPGIYSILARSGLVKERPDGRGLIVKVIGSIYVDGDMHIYRCINDRCEIDEQFEEMYYKQVELLRRLVAVEVEHVQLPSGAKVARWV